MLKKILASWALSIILYQPGALSRAQLSRLFLRMEQEFSKTCYIRKKPITAILKLDLFESLHCTKITVQAKTGIISRLTLPPHSCPLANDNWYQIAYFSSYPENGVLNFTGRPSYFSPNPEYDNKSMISCETHSLAYRIVRPAVIKLRKMKKLFF
jgi:hypothetical protein